MTVLNYRIRSRDSAQSSPPGLSAGDEVVPLWKKC